MGTKQFDNVKITSTFTEAETKADLVSGSAIGTLFGQVQKNLKDLDNKERVLTKAEYDTLTEEEKNNDTIYFISDIGGDNLNTDPSSYYTKTEIDTKLTDNYYTKNEIDNKFPKCTYAHSESNGFIKILSLKIRDANLGQDSQTYLRFYDNKLLNDQNNGELFINFRGGGGSGKVPQCQIQVVRADASWNPLSRIKGIYYKQDN